MILGSYARTGLFAGLLLAVAGILGGLAGFTGALALGVLGLLAGRWADGDLDLTALAERSGLTGRQSDRVR